MLTDAEILQFIGEDKTSTKKRLAGIGQKYYEAEHDILQYRVFYYNADGNLVEDKIRSNIKIPHPFFTELVDQEVQYMLSGKDGFIKSDIPELQDRLDEYFDDDFNSELNDVLTGAVSKGFDYMFAYMNSDGRLAFQHADSMGAPSVCESNGVFNVSYNGSLIEKCPKTFLISSRINWTPYFDHIINCVKSGKEIETDWTGNLLTGSVELTEINKNVSAKGTDKAISEAKSAIESGNLKIFDPKTFTVNRKNLTSYMADVDTDPNFTGDKEVIFDGYFHESEFRSAPYFDLKIDGIKIID